MEIGSFIELQMPKGMEYYIEGKYNGMSIARLNTGRAAIYHAFAVSGCTAIWLPYYQCDTVREFLERKNSLIKYYHIDSLFEPIDLDPAENECVLLVNYFGIMSHDRMKRLAGKYRHVIIDNAQGFFHEPVEGCFNIYSARKFVGVPDGAYVIGKSADTGLGNYEQGYSSDTALFMLQRIEYGCEGKAYTARTENENRIDTEDCKLMSRLTQYILDGTDYQLIRDKRRENFEIACSLFKEMNRIDPKQYYDDTCVPMVYPLVVEDEGLLERLLQAKHFQGRWWSYIVDELPPGCFEVWLSKYMIPITIDQRYGEEELNYLESIIRRTTK